MEKAWRAYVAELIATFTLVFIGAGAICLDVSRGGVGLVGIALAHGLAIFVMCAAVGHISGAHINPAVTLGVWVAKKIETQTAVGYILAQLVGAVLGAWVLKCFYPYSLGMPAVLGTPMIAASLTMGQAVFVEAILTFLVVFVVFGSAVDARGPKIGGLAIGMTVAMDILMGGPLTGAAMNPARAFGPALVAGFWKNQSVYWVGPLLGGAAAGWIYSKLYLKR